MPGSVEQEQLVESCDRKNSADFVGRTLNVHLVGELTDDPEGEKKRGDARRVHEGHQGHVEHDRHTQLTGPLDRLPEVWRSGDVNLTSTRQDRNTLGVHHLYCQKVFAVHGASNHLPRRLRC